MDAPPTKQWLAVADTWNKAHLPPCSHSFLRVMHRSWRLSNEVHTQPNTDLPGTWAYSPIQVQVEHAEMHMQISGNQTHNLLLDHHTVKSAIR